MIKQFKNIRRIKDRDLFDRVSIYCDNLIDEATINGALDELDADNEYTREITRVANLCIDYETYFSFPANDTNENRKDYR